MLPSCRAPVAERTRACPPVSAVPRRPGRSTPHNGHPSRFVVHLPVQAVDLLTAARLARLVARTLGFLPQVDPGDTTVSAEDDQGVRHQVFCDRPMAGGRRCLLRPDHDGPCTRRLPR